MRIQVREGAPERRGANMTIRVISGILAVIVLGIIVLRRKKAA